MGYATVDFYKNEYHGNTIPDDDIQNLLDRASLKIDTLTRRKITLFGGFDSLSEYEKYMVKMAACYQADHEAINKASLSGVSSYSIGDVSVSLSEVEEYSKDCLFYLNNTRLMYRGL